MKILLLAACLTTCLLVDSKVEYTEEEEALMTDYKKQCAKATINNLRPNDGLMVLGVQMNAYLECFLKQIKFMTAEGELDIVKIKSRIEVDNSEKRKEIEDVVDKCGKKAGEMPDVFRTGRAQVLLECIGQKHKDYIRLI